jgi:hypothetical protein
MGLYFAASEDWDDAEMECDVGESERLETKIEVTATD